ncbi:hypothetical protein [Pontibacter sp. G13]|uniref:hypothetical protein n=1 Tax=Pontibacter sp. G13 TaxID=3074898 RepID=UPI00288A19B1|nr:hypothetical protein [Pontibacter sp. G13]WNJ21046.1 hypothetical protein RJD25_11300 [Pontibacter sp. G13]
MRIIRLLAPSLLFLLVLSCPITAKAQFPYSVSIGGHVGSPNGLTAKFFPADLFAIETMMVYRRGGGRLMTMGEVHFVLGRFTESFVYIGGGFHVGMINLNHDVLTSSVVYGLDGVIGYEFPIPDTPLSFGLDYIPILELKGERKFSGGNGGVFLRYIFQ